MNFYFRLMKIWREIFSTEFFDDFPVEESPILIGIIRLFDDKTNELSTLKYQFKSLIKFDTIQRTQQRVTRELILDELCHFKLQCDENEKTSVSFYYLVLFHRILFSF